MNTWWIKILTKRNTKNIYSCRYSKYLHRRHPYSQQMIISDYNNFNLNWFWNYFCFFNYQLLFSEYSPILWWFMPIFNLSTTVPHDPHYIHYALQYLGDNCIVFENFMASIGDLMVANWAYWRCNSGASKRIFATMKSTIDAVKFSNTILLSPF